MSKHKVICIDAPDGAGKTTLSEYIIENYKSAYIHINNFKEKVKTINQHLPMCEFAHNWTSKEFSDVVLDRSWICLYIYSLVFDNDNELQLVENFLDNYLNYLDSLIDKYVICLPPKELYLQNYNSLKNKRNELYDTMEEIYSKYQQFVNGELKYKINPNKIFVYNYIEDGKDMNGFLTKNNIL